LQRHEIVETPVIDQLHYHIELPVICSRIEYLYHTRMIHRGSNARLFLQSSFMILFATEISAQRVQRHEPIQLHIACFINGAHPANTKRLDHDEMIERLSPRVFSCHTLDRRSAPMALPLPYRQSSRSRGMLWAVGSLAIEAAIVTFSALGAMK
jgi:hypothetical protein